MTSTAGNMPGSPSRGNRSGEPWGVGCSCPHWHPCSPPNVGLNCGISHLGQPGSSLWCLRPWSWWRQRRFLQRPGRNRGNKHADERGQQPRSGFWSQVVPSHPAALPSTTTWLDPGPFQDLSHGHLMQPPAPLDMCLNTPHFPRMGACPDILGEPSKPQLPGLQFGGGKMSFSP